MSQCIEIFGEETTPLTSGYDISSHTASESHLLTALMDIDKSVRANAADALRGGRIKEGTDRLIGALYDPEAEVRLAVVEALGTRNDMRAVEPLLRLLRTVTDNATRIAVMRTLDNLQDALAIPALLEILNSRDPELHRQAIFALRDFPEPSLVPVFIDALKDRDIVVRCQSAKALAQQRDLRALVPLLTALPREQAVDRDAIIAALGSLGHADAVEVILPALHNKRTARTAQDAVTRIVEQNRSNLTDSVLQRLCSLPDSVTQIDYERYGEIEETEISCISLRRTAEEETQRREVTS